MCRRFSTPPRACLERRRWRPGAGSDKFIPVRRSEAWPPFLTALTDCATEMTGKAPLVARDRAAFTLRGARPRGAHFQFMRQSNPPQSAEAPAQLAALPAGAAHAMRAYPHGDYLMLYPAMEADATVSLRFIRHQRQLSFDFARLWPGARSPTNHADIALGRERQGGQPVLNAIRYQRDKQARLDGVVGPRGRGAGLPAGTAGYGRGLGCDEAQQR